MDAMLNVGYRSAVHEHRYITLHAALHNTYICTVVTWTE